MRKRERILASCYFGIEMNVPLGIIKGLLFEIDHGSFIIQEITTCLYYLFGSVCVRSGLHNSLISAMEKTQ